MMPENIYWRVTLSMQDNSESSWVLNLSSVESTEFCFKGTKKCEEAKTFLLDDYNC